MDGQIIKVSNKLLIALRKNFSAQKSIHVMPR